MIDFKTAHQVPPSDSHGFIPTLNSMGYMTATKDRYMREFITFSALCREPVLDIGAAYGIATIAALEAGASVIANGIDPKHLQILQSLVSQEQRDHLTLLPGAFPHSLDLPELSIGAVLIARVVHFFDPMTLEASAEVLFRCLVPEGKVFLTAETPYLGNWKAFHAIYEERKAMGNPWPGFIEDVPRYCSNRSSHLPAVMHLLDPEVLTRTFQQAGFLVEEAQTFPRPEFPTDLQFDGRESVGLIARKPA